MTMTPAAEPIKVWRFQDAPKELQNLSDHGGDEDWLAVVPKELVEDYISWMQVGPFGCSSVTRAEWRDGSQVVIGAHA